MRGVQCGLERGYPRESVGVISMSCFLHHDFVYEKYMYELYMSQPWAMCADI